MTPKQRMAIRTAFILVALAGGLLTTALTQQRNAATTYAFSGTFYGAYESLMTQAISGNIWPQATSNACAITDTIGVVNYDYLRWGFPLRFVNSDSQSIVEKGNQTLGQSQWGYATPINQWGGITNIARDFGNDPRSVAYDISRYNVVGTYWHNYIYRWQFAHSTQPSFSQQASQYAARQGVIISAIGPAKWKTGFQSVWVGSAFFWFFAAAAAARMRWTSDAWRYFAYFNGIIGTATMIGAVALTLYSLGLYARRYGYLLGSSAREAGR